MIINISISVSEFAPLCVSITNLCAYCVCITDAATGSINGPCSRWCVRRPNGRPGEAKTHSAAAGPAAACTQVPAAGAGQRGGEDLHPAPLPHHEERTQPYDPLPGWQSLPR